MSGYEYVLIYLFYFILLMSHRKGEGEGERGNKQTNKIPIWAYNALFEGP